jgi:hypothetical protein|tara:strand:- start:651 stop:1304 length:654 start_codon:yes stop_codon:yes gene_type:complete
MTKNKKDILYLVFILLAIFFLWNTLALYPLQILVVFFHESSHALAAILTGGEVMEMEISYMQGGHVLSRGGSRFITLSAGYLGSLIWGLIIYFSAVRTDIDKFISFALGSIIATISLIFVRNSFGLIFGLIGAAGLIFLGLKASLKINDFVLRVIGLTSMLYAPLDIFSDTIERSYLRSDARMLADEFGGTTIIWGGIWILISSFLIIFCLKLSHKK